jgi:hypothetical protein
MDTLTQRVLQLEERSDDDLVIGRLQREAIAMRTAYRLFTRIAQAQNFTRIACSHDTDCHR